MMRRSEAPAPEVVLATFNGAAHIDALLASLAAQTVPLAVLRVCDDGSWDDTRAVIARWQQVLPLRLLDAPPGAGAGGNFGRLLDASVGDYVMLADQDDVWDSDKIARSMAEMQMLEARWGVATPLLVHGDLRLVDAQLRPIAGSFMDHQHLDPQAISLDRLLLQNVVTGCTVLVNRPLLDLALPIPPEAPMHDWWLAVVAATFGRIGYVPQATVAYRQHDRNAIGAKGRSKGYLKSKLQKGITPHGAASLLWRYVQLARVFKARWGDSIPPPAQRKLLDWLSELPAMSRLARVHRGLSVGARKHGLLSSLFLYWAVAISNFSGYGE